MTSSMLSVALFALIVALLLIHEMDAVRAREWRMFIILKDLPDDLAYRIFVIAHLSLYFAVIMIIVQGGAIAGILAVVLDVFIIGHTLIHYCFRRKDENGFTSVFSRMVIYSLGLLAIGHLSAWFV